MSTVLVTRPRHQQQTFISLCESLGLHTFSLPLLRILPNEVDEVLWQSRLVDSNTAWIFTSRNAVEHCPFDINPVGPVFAMGASTAQALTASGRTLAAIPEVPFNSEVLVEQLRHANTNSAVIVTGIGGRAYLGKELRSMNWEVTEVRCYKRVAEKHTNSVVAEALNASDILSLTSIESMDVLLALIKQDITCKPNNWLSKPLVVNSGRAVLAAKKAGFSGEIYTAVPAGDQGQITAIKKLLNET